MAKSNETYSTVIVESYKPQNTSGLHGEVHIRPVAGQDLPTTLHVSCSRELKSASYPVGTKFRIQAKLTDREEGGEYLYSPPRAKFEVIS
ncbi:MAG: hypothetical protein DI628_07725 [Blastochloris viridis]|uniref:Uncharacterized protein n=1 Tax=Blastochloris viridis TaxID=1079 RepID=A0A6N4R0Q4_BLAVI|nr:MAG: hypothetical protein DI628_07725 [Blastochloris viridis]